MIAITAALLMLVLIGVVALAVDLGYIVLTKTQLQAACDSAALAAATELWAPGTLDNRLPSQIVTAAKNRAFEYAYLNPNGDQSHSYLNRDRDVVLTIFSGNGKPYIVTVTLRRNVVGSANGDAPLPLLFGPLLNNNSANISVQASAIRASNDTTGLIGVRLVQ